MNESSGKIAVKYGRIGEDYAIKKYKLFRTNGSHDALAVTGDLFGMSEKPIEIKSAQLFSKTGGYGEFMFNVDNHNELIRLNGDYIFVFMFRETVLFDLKFHSSKIQKGRGYKIPRKNKADFFRINTNFFAKLK